MVGFQVQERQIEGCKRQLAVVQFEHEYIKDQLTTTEVGALCCANVYTSATDGRPIRSLGVRLAARSVGGRLAAS